MYISGSTPVPRPDRRCLGRYTSIRSLSIFMDPMRGTTVRSPRVSCSDLPSGWVGGWGVACGGGGEGLLLWGREVRGVAPSTRVRVL